MARNQYPGTCYHCKGNVPKGGGFYERFMGGFRVQHDTCCDKARRLKAEAASKGMTLQETKLYVMEAFKCTK